MKLMIASDLHGSVHYCRLLLNAFRMEQADRLILLGDLLYHGPRNPLPLEYDTQTVAAMLNEVADKLLCVRGNCDADVDQLVLNFPILAENAWISADGATMFATHGHNLGPDNIPPLQPGSYLLCGHIHLPVCQKLNQLAYLNPGSTSLPKEGMPHSYMLFESGTFSWYDLETGIEFQPLDHR